MPAAAAQLTPKFILHVTAPPSYFFWYVKSVLGWLFKRWTFCKTKEIKLLTSWSETLSSSKCSLRTAHTFLSVPFIAGSIAEELIGKRVQYGRRVLHNVHLWLKSGSLNCFLQLGEQPKVTRSHVGRICSRRSTGMLCLPKNICIRCQEWGTTLLWWSCYCLVVHRSGCYHRTPWWRRRKTSRC